MPFHRHVGKIKSTSQRCLVVFRQVPDEPDSCLVTITDQLPDRFHTDIINGVESISAQQELEFASYAARTPLSSGENMFFGIKLARLQEIWRNPQKPQLGQTWREPENSLYIYIFIHYWNMR